MRLAHPSPKPLSPLNPRLVPRPLHPILEVFGADPAGVELAEEGEEGAHFGLEGGGRGGRVGCGEGVQEGPGVPA